MTSQTVCVVGSGAREHALALSLGRSADVVVTPGNPGIQGTTAQGFTLTSDDRPASLIEADLYVIGPEAPLVSGLADELRASGRLVFGPGRDGARLEGSKMAMKQLCSEAGIPTARWACFDELWPAVRFLRALPGPYVVKTDGLAAGKGVLVTPDVDEAISDVAEKLSGSSFGAAGERVVIEEAMCGPELSLFAVCDGARAIPLAPAQDYKRVGDGDTGPNTGGMGACSPLPRVGDALVGEVMDRIVMPALSCLRRDGVDYRGLLYAGLMVTPDGPRLVEFNVRFGDPETEVVLPRMGGDLTHLLACAAEGDLRPAENEATFRPEAAVCVVAAAPGYPVAPVLGGPIEGVERAGTLGGVTVFHAGTSLTGDGVLITAGGRVLCLMALGPDVASARRRAYEAVGLVDFEGKVVRNDIAEAAARGELR